MKKLYIVANWKANKTNLEAKEWLQEISNFNPPAGGQISNDKEKEVVVCPPVTLLSLMHDFVKQNDLSLYLGAQDVSPFGMGAYTGEVAAEQLKELAQYVIVGHSERRKNFHEDDEIIAKKVERAMTVGLEPILCVQGADTPIPNGVHVVAYEPVFAIGTGTPDTPENANAVAKEIKNKHKDASLLYGGSVTSENVASFTHQEH